MAKYDNVNPLEKLHDGEPYFFLRAQDIHAPATVADYAERLRKTGDKKGWEQCLVFSERIREWQRENLDKVKKPD